MNDLEERCDSETPDQWDKDLGVRAMRRVFAAMEEAQRKYIETLGLSPFDPRLRRWRERALAAFEASWARAARAGVDLTEEESGLLYVHCLRKVLAREGMDTPPEIFSENQRLKKIVREVFP